MKTFEDFNEMITTKTSHIIVERDEFLEDFNEIKNLVKDLICSNIMPYICVQDTTLSTSTKVNYCYSKEYLDAFLDLEVLYHENSLECGIIFSEIDAFKDEKSFENSFTMEDVNKANDIIHTFVEETKQMHLTPFETMLHIHKFVNEFTYLDSESTDSKTREFKRTILGFGAGKDLEGTTGHASLVQAIINLLDDPNLKCKTIATTSFGVNRKEVKVHEYNVITINDKKYNIDGHYVEDASLVDINDFDEFHIPVHTCLFPINDLTKLIDRVLFHTGYSMNHKVIINPNNIKEYESIMNSALTEYEKFVKLHKQFSSIKNKKDKSTPINSEQYRAALINLLKKRYMLEHNTNTIPNNVLEGIKGDVDDIIEETIDSFNDVFTDDSASCFSARNAQNNAEL